MTTLIVSGYQTIIRKQSKQLVVERKGVNGEVKRERFPVVNLSGVVVDVAATITGYALELLMTHSIPVIHLSRFNAIGISHPVFSHGSVIVRKQQFEALNDHRGWTFVKAMLTAALTNRRRLLQYYLRKENLEKDSEEEEIAGEETKKTLEEAVKRIEALEVQAEGLELDRSIDAMRPRIMGIEGAGGQAYFQGLKVLVPESWRFRQRIKRPTEDPFNALISYLYVILSSRVTIQAIVAGLEPYAGFVHSDRSGRASLGLDLMEQFRQPFVDRFALRLARRRSLNPKDHFHGLNEPKEGDSEVPVIVDMTDEGKKVLFPAWEEWLEDKTEHFDRKMTRTQIIREQVQELVRVFMRKRDTYRPYVGKY